MRGVTSILVVVLSLSFLSPPKATAQYSDADIGGAIQMLKQWNMLDDMVRMTELDKRQAATRGEVLVSCFLVLKELRGQNYSGLQRELSQLQLTVTSLQQNEPSTPANQPGAVTASETELINKTLTEVESKLSGMDSFGNLAGDVGNLRRDMDELTRQVDNARLAGAGDLQKQVRTNRIIASAAVVLSLVLSITSAR